MAVAIRSRSSWGAGCQDGDLTLTGLALEVFAHHTVTTQLSPSASVEAEEAEMRKVEAIGQSRFGTGISYNVIVFPSGRAYQGVSWNRRGTHTGGRNSTTRSICFAGNYEENEPTPAQLATAAAIYAEGKGKWWKSTAPLRGHRDVKETACPGENVYTQLPAIRASKTQAAPTVQEDDMTLTTAQAKQLDDLHRLLLRKFTDGADQIDIVDAGDRALAVARRTESDVNELYAGTAPKIDKTAELGGEKITLRTAIKEIRLAVTGQLDDAVAKGVTAALKNVTGVDKAALTAGVVAEVRKVIESVGDTEYVLTPKEG